MFIDYSSTFYTIGPTKLIINLTTMRLTPSLCIWILDFLMGCSQVVRVGKNTCHADPQHGPLGGACLVPSCTSCPPKHNTIKFADDNFVRPYQR